LFFTEGRAAATPVLKDAIAALASTDSPEEELLRWGFLASRAANVVWDYDSSLEISMRAVQVARASGTLEALPPADNACGQAAALGGDFETASLLIAEVIAVREATGMRIAPHGTIALAALRGEEEEASRLIGRVVTEATAAGQGTAVQYAHWANSVLMNGLGRYEDALAAAVRATEHHTPELFIALWALCELIEAATRTQNDELATDALERLGEHAQASDGDWPAGLHARSEALLTNGAAAAAGFRPCTPALRRVASPGEPTRRRARATAQGT
jgi:hypothetical protein